MKKLFVISLLVLAFAATAYSQDKLDFRASGFIDMRTNLWRWNLSNQVNSRPGIINVTPDTQVPPGMRAGSGGEWNKTGNYIEERGRLKFDAVMGKSLSGTFFFEIDSQTWGDFASGGAGQPSGRNRAGFWSGDRSSIEVKNLYMDVAIPYIPIPMTLRAGLQPFGIRSNMFWYNDGTGITLAAKVDPVTIIGYYAKAYEGLIANSSDDIDYYGGQIMANISTVTAGIYGVYQRARSYPMQAVTDATPYGSTVNSVYSNMFWYGGYVDGKLGPVNLNFDFVADTGYVKRPNLEQKVKYSGWASRLKVDFPWEAFNFGVVGAYGSGADARKTSKFGVPNERVVDPYYAAQGMTSERVGSFVVPIESETGSFSESEVLFASYVGGGYTGIGYTGDGNRMCRGSVGGLWLAKLYASYKVTPAIKLTLQGLYIGDNTKNGDTFGYALSDPTNAASPLKNGSSIGWEADVIGEWQVYKNLSFKASFGWLWPGNAMKFWYPAKADNVKPSDPYALFTNLTYSF